jgi:16S rRNA (cytosine1402-N4)-methyltransferase
MRMGPDGPTAAEAIADVDEATLAGVLRDLGEEPFARAIARSLKAAHPTTTQQAVEAVKRAVPRRAWPSRIHVATRTFQALRIWVNDEAAELEAALEWLPGAVRPDGVVVTLAYHSGEDRRIKQALRGRRESTPARRRPVALDVRPPEGPWQELTRSVVTPSPEEKARNPRARSARLRAFRRSAA